MLIFHESGRLGNQLFQYAALRSLCPPEEKLVLLGFSELQATFEGLNAKIINANSSRLDRSLYYRFYKIANHLSQKKIIARIKESKKLAEIFSEPGLFKQIVFVEECYFQSELFFNPKTINSLTLKSHILVSAQKLLNAIAMENYPIFVHIRRGDYLTWPEKDQPAVLPAGYYQKCINIVQSKIPDAFFIFTSDDPFYVKDLFGELKNSYISQGSILEDFALMTQCRGGILSASSFSWWGAYFAKLSHPNGIFLAPKYWAGHRKKSWYPSNIKSNFLTYIEI